MGFSIIFNVPRKEILLCGLTGIIGWIVFTLITYFVTDSIVVSTFFSAVTVTALARFKSEIRKMPSTIYMIPGIIPLVPGLRLYFTMFYVVNGEFGNAAYSGATALSIAGVIAVGLLVVLSLPRKWFSLKRRKA